VTSSNQQRTFQKFFSELKRRNVCMVAIAYGVVAWLLIQAVPSFL